MKKRIITSLLLLFCLTGFSQDLSYTVRGKYKLPIKKEKLNTVNVMSDLISGYPASWIMSYVSVEVTATCNGKELTANGANAIFTEEQKNILNTVDLGAVITINIRYKCKNAVTGDIEISKMHYSATAVPEIEAEYTGGLEEMKQYLKENAIEKISEERSKQMPLTLLRFTVNEAGEIANAKIAVTSGDVKIDNLLLEAINKMPKWKPAENSKGVKVKQEFEFSVGNQKGGC